jgi:hypothetical protein
VSGWLLFNANSAIFQIYLGENKLIFHWDDDEVNFVQDKHAELDFYSALSSVLSDKIQNNESLHEGLVFNRCKLLFDQPNTV